MALECTEVGISLGVDGKQGFDKQLHVDLLISPQVHLPRGALVCRLIAGAAQDITALVVLEVWSTFCVRKM